MTIGKVILRLLMILFAGIGVRELSNMAGGLHTTAGLLTFIVGFVIAMAGIIYTSPYRKKEEEDK